MIFSEDEEANSQQELDSEFLSEKESEFDFEAMAPKVKKPINQLRETKDAKDVKNDNYGSKRPPSKSASISEEDDEESL